MASALASSQFEGIPIFWVLPFVQGRVNVIGVVADTPDEDNEALAKSILDKKGVKFDNIIPDKDLHEWILKNVKGTPTTIFVDKDGKIVSTALVGTASKAEYNAKIDEVLKSIK